MLRQEPMEFVLNLYYYLEQTLLGKISLRGFVSHLKLTISPQANVYIKMI